MQSDQHRNTEMLAKLARTESYLALDPGNHDLLATAIDLAIELGQPECAARHADAALGRYPDDAFFQARMGNVFIAQQKWDAAAVLFESLFARHADVNLAYNLAYCYVWQGQHRRAWDTLSPYLAQGELASMGVTLLVRALHHMGQLEQAIELVTSQMARCQDDSVFLAAASVLYLDAGQLEQAARLSALALERGQRPLEALVVGGTLALAHTDAAAAASQFNEALALNPAEGRSWSGLGMASLLKRDLPAARSALKQALVYLPGHIGTWHLLGWCEIFSVDLDGAEAAFRHALELDRNFGDSHGGLAVVQAMRGQRAAAEVSIARALGLDRQSLSARYAQMVLSGQTADPATFRTLALGLLSSRQGAFNQNLGDVLKDYEAR